MAFDRRMLGLLVLVAVIGIPALALRLACVGHACDEPVAISADIPFCSLPEKVRGPIAAGFRDGRSPEVMAVTGDVTVGGGHTFARGRLPQWPSSQGLDRRVPLLISGRGVDGGIPDGTTLDDVAPTVAHLMGIERPHPEVRSGTAIEGIGSETPAPLVVEIVWKGVGSSELEADPESWPALSELAEDAVFTLDARVPSVPLEPAPVLATIGAGGTPAQHGITGARLRTDEGLLVEAWSPDAPVSVIAALGDDLDELTGQRARVGLLAHDRTDRGLIGANWYVRTDRDDVELIEDPGEVPSRVKAMLRGGYAGPGYGTDEDPDLLGVTLQAPIAQMDEVTRKIVELVNRTVDGAVVVVTGTGSSVRNADLNAQDVAQHVDRSVGAAAVEGIAPGGLFLDGKRLADREIPEDRIVTALSEMQHMSGRKVFSDVFPAIAVSFGRYC